MGEPPESREALLEGKPKGIHWYIATEREVNGYILSGIYSTGGRLGIAAFAPTESGRYQFISKTWRNPGRIVISSFYLGSTWYDAVWLNEETAYAEMTYTCAGQPPKTLRFETANMPILFYPAPMGDYTLDVVYYDTYGNRWV